jgi:hypothetical protein
METYCLKKRIIYILLVWIILFIVNLSGYAQSKAITGIVSDAATGEAIIGASISVTGTSRGALTDIDGKFSITAAPDEILTISYLAQLAQLHDVFTSYSA